LSTAKLGVIGGSGLYDLPELSDTISVDVETPFGLPSAEPRIGKIGDTEVVFLARHGRDHSYSPSNLPYQANIYALKQLGVTHVISVSAVGSLRDALPPRSLVLPDQIIDRTVIRPRTFFDRDVIAHVGIAEPYCPRLRERLAPLAKRHVQTVQTDGTYICIEGPQFSTRAESRLFRTWDASVIGMTAMPEARLAREAELCYATIALVTDYDVWHDVEAAVTVDIVVANLTANTEAARHVIGELIASGLHERTCPCGEALAGAIMTNPNAISAQERDRLGLIAARHLSCERTT
jgi:5'-methylthioadenosine phosphorylase